MGNTNSHQRHRDKGKGRSREPSQQGQSLHPAREPCDELREQSELEESFLSQLSSSSALFDRRLCNKCLCLFSKPPRPFQPIPKRRIAYKDLKSSAISGCIWCENIVELLDSRWHTARDFKSVMKDLVPCDLDILTAAIYINQENPENDLELAGLRVEVKVQDYFHSFIGMVFQIYARQGDPASELILLRPLNPLVSSPRSMSFAKESLKNCLEKHEQCPNPGKTILPTRVIDVGDSENYVRLHISRGEFAQYAALTYCWGSSQTFKTGLSNIDEMTSRIDFDNLPLTIRDAILTTQRVGLRYLWIDSLCIIQDSIADKLHEIANMDSIYENATITISAASAISCHSGFLQDRKPYNSDGAESISKTTVNGNTTILPASCVFPVALLDGAIGSCVVERDRQYYAEQEPINTRAWTYQEQLLSPRILVFGTYHLYWQCASITRHSEDGPGYQLFGEKLRLDLVTYPLKKRHIASCEDLNTDDPSGISERWMEVVKHYSTRSISDPSDKLVALSGIASRISHIRQGAYRAGLWQDKSFLWEVLWVRKESKGANYLRDTLAPRTSAYRSPTWSWASIEGEITFLDNDLILDKALGPEILECVTTLESDEAPYGRVNGGYLKMRGHMLRLQLNSTGETFLGRTDSGFIGAAYWDVAFEESDRSRMYAFRIAEIHGLILIKRNDGKFERRGIFDSFTRTVEGLDLWAGLLLEIITIV